MRSNKMKVLVLASLATVCVGAASLSWNNDITASAASGFVMVDGASVRMSTTADETAIRFIAKVSDTEKTYRMLILPTAVLEYNKIEAGDDIVAELKTVYGENYEQYFVDFAVKASAHEEYGDCVMGAMNRVNSKYYNQEYTGIAYYIDGDDYVYANFSEGVDIYSNARTVSYVGSKALNEKDYVVKDDAKTTAEQKAALESFVKGALGGDALIVDQQDDDIVKVGETIELTTNATGLAVNYESSNEDVLTVDKDGKVEFVGKGSANVIVSIGDSFSDEVAYTVYSDEGYINRLLLENYTANSGTMNKNFTGTLGATVENFADNASIHTSEVSEYDTYVHYSATAAAYSGAHINFINFSAYTDTKNTRAPMAMTQEMLDIYKDLDWANAYVSFWIYVDTDFTKNSLQIRGTQASTGVDYSNNAKEDLGAQFTSAKAKTWTKVTAKLSDICSELDVEGGNYNIKLWAYLSGTMNDYSFYVTGFEFYNLNKNDMTNNALLKNYTANSGTMNKNFTGTLGATVENFADNASIHTSEVSEYDTYVHYSATAAAYSGAHINFINFSAYTDTKNTRAPMAMTQEMLDIYKDLDWANAYVSFWIYVDTDFTKNSLQIRGTQASTGVDYSNNAKEDLGAQFTSAKAKTWTKVTAKLSDICSELDVEGGNYNIKLWAYLSGTKDDYSFYVTGFEFLASLPNA